MLADLRAEHEKRVLLPKADSQPGGDADARTASSTPVSAAAASSTTASTAPRGLRTATVSLDVELLASYAPFSISLPGMPTFVQNRADDVFQAFTNVDRVRIWTQSDAQVAPKANAPLSYFNNTVTGTVVDCVRAHC